MKSLFKRNGVKREFKYNAVIWVLLDRYTIKKYKSDDIPMKLFSYRKFKRGISLSTAISKDIGEVGTKEREEFEKKVMKEIEDWGL
jgi:hypothetical protein